MNERVGKGVSDDGRLPLDPPLLDVLVLSSSFFSPF